MLEKIYDNLQTCMINFSGEPRIFRVAIDKHLSFKQTLTSRQEMYNAFQDTATIFFNSALFSL